MRRPGDQAEAGQRGDHRAGHTVRNVVAWLGVAESCLHGLVIITGFERADSIASLMVAGLMLRAAWGLLRETGRVLLEAAPEGYAPDDIVAAITGRMGPPGRARRP